MMIGPLERALNQLLMFRAGRRPGSSERALQQLVQLLMMVVREN